MGRKESNQTVNKQNSMCGLSSCDSPYLLILTAREKVKSISFDIWGSLDLPERPELPERPPKYRKDQRIIEK